jgi:hypothetical protein
MVVMPVWTPAACATPAKARAAKRIRRLALTAIKERELKRFEFIFFVLMVSCLIRWKPIA